MTLSPGTKLGPYEVVAAIGAGGMGEVYRARDARLSRDVAVKVLPEELFEGEERRQRFEREARLLAALNHPGIAAIYSFEEIPSSASSASRHILVMELLEGETLRAKLAGGAIAPRKAVDFAQQMAQGLAAAHDKGIVHRDLKPENVFVTKDGRVKILDFGLARQAERKLAEDETSAPTAARHTDPGTVMGTVGYMSPEQVKGLPVDNRSDLFAFGAILHEMLSGRIAFKRDTPPETLTAILREEPADLSGPNRIVDPALERLVRHCLEKSPEERFQSARDLAYALSTLTSSSGALSGATGAVSARAAGRRFRPAIPAAVAAGILLGAVATGVLLRPRPIAPPEFQVLTYSGSDGQPSVSPDGRTIAFVSSRDGRPRVWVKQVVGGAEAVLTEGPDAQPRVSPDGSSVLFLRSSAAEASVYRAALVGGEARRVVGPAVAADWSPDGKEIVFLRTSASGGTIDSSLRRIALDGTNERTVANVPGRLLTAPRWSPDGTTIAALESPGTGTATPKLVLFPVDGSAPTRVETPETRAVLGYAWNGDSRRVVFLGGASSDANSRSRTAKVFLKDVRTGTSRAVISGIDFGGSLDVFGNGALILVTLARRSNLREVSAAGAPGPGRWLTRGGSIDRQPVYAPDGEWVAFTSNRSGNQDIWELSTKTGAVRRLTEDPADDFDPAFTRDGKSLIFSSNRGGHFEIWIATRDGSGARRVTDDGLDAENASATPDGKWLVYSSGNPDKRGIWKIRPDGTGATRLVGGPVILPEISPDGRVVSFVTVSGPDGSTSVSGGANSAIGAVRLDDGTPVPFEAIATGAIANRGRHRWTPDGASLVFLTGDRKETLGLTAQPFIPGRDTSSARRSVAGFMPDSLTESFGISPDGSRMTISEFQVSLGLLLAEGVEGIVARPAHGVKP
ncbi:MAG: serine/threonine-protein kinase [Acidobacteria bacterium]|nr:serine/threonine-protein kinase [Acidobacteriota bacterium]